MITKEGFAETLQTVLNQHNVKTSKERAWKIFKSIIFSIADSVVVDDDNKISLSGIGNFELLKATPRGTKEGVVDYVPRLRYRPSSKINTMLEEATDQVPDPEKVAKKRAELEKAGKLTTNLPNRGAKAETPSKKTTKTTKAKKAEVVEETGGEGEDFEDDF